MNYPFPIIEHIDDVLPYIDNNPMFYVKDAGSYKVINYILGGYDTFPEISGVISTLYRECRGLVFDGTTGKLISRGFHKFFNLNERPETRVDNLDYTDISIYEKLDGSFARPCYINGHIRWISKLGITSVSHQFETYAVLRKNYMDMAADCLSKGFTPIFEWCSNKQRIVLNYPQDELILLAIRDMRTGKYLSRFELEEYSIDYEIPLVSKLENRNILDMICEYSQKTGIEGCVIQFPNGHRVKLKTQWYVDIHRAKDCVNNEHNLLRCIIEEKIDDLKSILLEEDVQNIEKYEHEFYQNIKKVTLHVNDICNKGIEKYGNNRKDFAFNIIPQHPEYAQLIWNCFDGHDIPSKILHIISKNLKSSKLDNIRHLIGTRYNEKADY
jgi:RNA ligase